MNLDHRQSINLKKWMIDKLRPICDSDPVVLSDYVVALLRHDQPDQGLKSSCLEQLDDFLAPGTQGFVDDLFDHLAQTCTPDRAPGPSTDTYQPSVPGASTLLGKRALSDDDHHHHHHPSIPFSSSLPIHTIGDPIHRPPLTSPLIPQYTPTRSHPSFLHFPISDTSNYEVPITLSSSHVQRNSPPQQSNTRITKKSRKSEVICRDYHCEPYSEHDQVVWLVPTTDGCNSDVDPDRGYCARGDNCQYSHSPQGSIAPSSSTHQFTPAYSPEQPLACVPSMLPPSQSSIEHLASSLAHQHIPGLGNPLALSNDLIASLISLNSNQQSSTTVDTPPTQLTRTNAQPSTTNNPKKLSNTLVVENIPQSSRSDRAVREYFSTFGPLISVSVDVYNAQALVVFASSDDAKKAHSSPEPVFNNRFVKIHFKRLGPTDHHNRRTPNHHHRGRGGHHHNNHNSNWDRQFSGPSYDATEQPAFDSEYRPEDNPRATSKYPATTPSTGQTEDHLTLSQREQELRIKIEAQKRILEELSLKKQKTVTSDPGSGISSSIEATKGESKENHAAAEGSNGSEKNGKLAKAQESSTEQGSKDDLESGAGPASHPLSPTSKIFANGRGASSIRGTPRSLSTMNSRTSWSNKNLNPTVKSFKLDNRSCSLAIQDIPSFSARESVRSYLEQFGTILSTAPICDDDQVPDFSVKFSTRSAAEKVLSQGMEIPEVGKVTISWFNSNNNNNNPSLNNHQENQLSLNNRSSSSNRDHRDDFIDENGDADGWKR